jgi:hypothetical protein
MTTETKTEPNTMATNPPGSWIKDLREFTLVIAIVVAFIFTLTVIAEHRAETLAQRPVQSNADGVVELLPIQAVSEGSITLYPTDFESQTNNFSYTHGRKVLKERLERKAGNWTDPETALTWKFEISQAGSYEIRVSNAVDEAAAGSEVRIQIGDQELIRNTRATGGWDKWKRMNCGKVTLSTGVHSLRLHPTSLTGRRFINLQKILITPVVANE